MINFSQLVLCFTLYSVMGWMCEIIWCSVGAGKIVSRGFLVGPWCPIYGFGALFILIFSYPVKNSPILIFVLSTTMASLVEYFTGWLMEALFQTRWWDYSGRRFNLKGRICLRNAIIFGLLGLTITYFFQPTAEQLIIIFRPETQRVLASLIFALFTFDLIHTLASITGLRERMENLRAIFDELERYQHEYTWYDRSDPVGSITRLRKIYSDTDISEKSALIMQRIDTIEQRIDSGFRMMNAFPKMRPKGLVAELETLRHGWSAKHKARNEKRKLWLSDLLNRIKQDTAAVCKGITLSRMIWAFLIGSIAGYVVETAYCLLMNGVIESRQGMLYGPFSQVYGFGAVLMILLLAPLSSRNNGWLFCGSAIVGGLFEVVCSLTQEALFGSVSWQYAKMPFALFGGRTNLLYMFFWGVLGAVYIRGIHPRIMNFTERLPKRPKHFFTWVITIGMTINMLISACAVSRWSDRIMDISPRNQIDEFLDSHYPNEMLEEIYPNMKFLRERGM